MPPLLPTLCFVDMLPHAMLCLLACSGGSKLTYLELPCGEAYLARNWAWRQSLPLRWLQPVRLPEPGTQLSHTYISFSIETNIINAIVCSQKVFRWFVTQQWITITLAYRSGEAWQWGHRVWRENGIYICVCLSHQPDRIFTTDVLHILFTIIATTWQGWCCSHLLDRLRLWRHTYLAQNT